MKEHELQALHERIAKALKWEVGDTYKFSMSALRAFVRLDDPQLYRELGEVILKGEYLLIELPKKV